MLKNILFPICCLLFLTTVFAQEQIEISPPYNIKTVTFVQNGQNAIPIFRLGDSFQLQFDDLYGNADKLTKKITAFISYLNSSKIRGQKFKNRD